MIGLLYLHHLHSLHWDIMVAIFVVSDDVKDENIFVVFFASIEVIVLRELLRGFKWRL